MLEGPAINFAGPFLDLRSDKMTNLEKVKQIMNGQDVGEGLIYGYQISNVDDPREIEYPELKDVSFDDNDGIPIVYNDITIKAKFELVDDEILRFNDEIDILINYATIAMPGENHPWYIIRWVDDEQKVKFVAIPTDWIGKMPDSISYKDVKINDDIRNRRTHLEAGVEE
jgi:hypothetical protein